MALKLIKSNDKAFIVDEVSDSLREKMGIVYGRAMHLYAERVQTPANPKGAIQYSDYFSDQAIQVCRKDSIIEERSINEEENAIYQKISAGRSLDGEDREYLRNNYYESTGN